jgi:hypothetical protein
MVRKMLRKRVVGDHKKQIDTVVGFSVASHDEGRARQLLEEMATDPAAPVEQYGGGHRDNVRLSSVQDAVDYLQTNGGDVPFGFD